MGKAAPKESQPLGPRSFLSWRKTAFIASLLAGGFAFYYNNHGVPSSKHSPFLQFRQPHFVPKHPSRLFKAEDASDEAYLSSTARVIVENQYSLVNTLTSSRVSRIDQNSIGSNEPCEDRHSETTFKLANGKLLHVFGVYDGHSGNECSESVRKFLPFYIGQSVNAIPGGKPETVSSAIQKSFESLDDEFLNVAMDPKFGHLPAAVTPALAGSVVCVVSIMDNDLYIANTGDVRAVMGSLSQDGKHYSAKALSIDHSAKNPSEVERMLAEHPNETKEVLLYRNRVLGGLMPTRAFGDASYKWKTEDMESLAKRILTNGYGQELAKRLRVISKSKTPPYVTARPEMFHYDLNESDKFIILASDGLWDVVSNEEAVGIVATYKREARKDENVASFLIRKSLEKVPDGVNIKEGDKYCAKLLSIPPPYSRNYRDDITVTIIFLSEESDFQLKNGHNITMAGLAVESDIQKKFSNQFDKIQSKL